MSRLGASLSLGQMAQKATGAIGSTISKAKATKDALTSSKTFKSLQTISNSLNKTQASLLKQSKKSGALEFLKMENEKEFQREQMEFWQILLQKLDSIEKKLDGLALGGGGEGKKGILSKLWNGLMGLLGLANTLMLIKQFLPQLIASIKNLNAKISNLIRRTVGLPEKPTAPKPGEAKPGEAKPGEKKPGEMKPGEEVKPTEEAKTPKEIAEEAKGKVRAEETKILEIRTELDKIYDALERQRQGLERNTAELEKARAELEKAGAEGNTEAIERLSRMETLYREEISRLEKTVNETREKLTTAQEKLVEARDISNKMEKAAIDAEKGFFEKLKQGFDTLIEDIKKTVNDVRNEFNKAEADRVAKQTKPTEPAKATEAKATEAPKATEPVTPAEAPKPAAETTTVKGTTTSVEISYEGGKGKGYGDVLPKEQAINSVPEEAKSAVKSDLQKINIDAVTNQAASNGGKTTVRGESGINYTIETQPIAADNGRPAIKRITVDASGVSFEVPKTTATGAAAPEAPKAPTAPEAPKAPTAPEAPTKGQTPRTQSATRISPQSKAGRVSSAAKGIGGFAAGTGVFTVMGGLDRWLQGEDLSKEDWSEIGGQMTAGGIAIEALMPLLAKAGLGPLIGPAMVIMAGSWGKELLDEWLINTVYTNGLVEATKNSKFALDTFINSESPADRQKAIAVFSYIHDYASAKADGASKGYGKSQVAETLEEKQSLFEKGIYPLPSLSEYIGKTLGSDITDKGKASVNRLEYSDLVAQSAKEILADNVDILLPLAPSASEEFFSAGFAGGKLSETLQQLVTEKVNNIEQINPEKIIYSREKLQEDIFTIVKRTDKTELEKINQVLSDTSESQSEPLQRNKGGVIPGRGPNKDTVPAMLTPGEFVLRRDAVNSIGLNNLYAMNEGILPSPVHFNEGGLVEQVPVTPIETGEETVAFIPTEQAEPVVVYPQQYFEDALMEQGSAYKEYVLTIDEETGKVIAEAIDPDTGLRYEVQGDEVMIAMVQNMQKLNDTLQNQGISFGDYDTVVPMPSKEQLLTMTKEDIQTYLKETLETIEKQKIEEGEFVYTPNERELLLREQLVVAQEEKKLAEQSYREATDESEKQKFKKLVDSHERNIQKITKDIITASSFNAFRRDEEIMNAVEQVQRQAEIQRTQTTAEANQEKTNRQVAEELLVGNPQEAPKPQQPTPTQTEMPELPSFTGDPVEYTKLNKDLKKTEDAIERIQNSLNKVNSRNNNNINTRTRRATLEKILEKKLAERERIITRLQEMSIPPVSNQANYPQTPTGGATESSPVEVAERKKEEIQRQADMLARNNMTQGVFKMGHLVDENNKVIDFDRTRAKSIEEAQQQVDSLFGPSVSPNDVTPQPQQPTAEQTTQTTTAQQVPAEKTKEQKEIELSNLYDQKETASIIHEKAQQKLMEDIQSGLSDEEYKKRQEEVNSLFARWEELSKQYWDKKEEYREPAEVGPPSSLSMTTEERLSAVWDTISETNQKMRTSLEASRPPESVILEEDKRITPGTGWVTALADASTSVHPMSSIGSVHHMGQVMASAADSGLYGQPASSSPQVQAVPEWSSQRKPIMASLFEETFNRLESMMSQNSNQGVVVNNSPTIVNNTSGGGGGGGDFASIQNSPRYSSVEESTLAALTGEYRKGAVV